jgi:hypothetical protein
MQEAREDFRAAYSRLLTAQTTSISKDAEEEEDLSTPEGNWTETHKKSGCPTGSTIKYSQAQELA